MGNKPLEAYEDQLFLYSFRRGNFYLPSRLNQDKKIQTQKPSHLLKPLQYACRVVARDRL